MTYHTPKVRFGMNAMQCALQAKGRRLPETAAAQLKEAAHELVPGDYTAARACELFAEAAPIDPNAAGRRLMNWLAGWSTGVAHDAMRREDAERGNE